MTIQEYNIKCHELEAIHRDAVHALKREFAVANAMYGVGDIVTDHAGSIKVARMACSPHGTPEPMYYGLELTKNIIPRKDGAKRWVYQSNIIAK